MARSLDHQGPLHLLVPAALSLAVVLHVGGEVPQLPLLWEVASFSSNIPGFELWTSLGVNNMLIY